MQPEEHMPGTHPHRQAPKHLFNCLQVASVANSGWLCTSTEAYRYGLQLNSEKLVFPISKIVTGYRFSQCTIT